MIFLKIIRVLITIVLVIALLISGGVVLFNYSISRVVLADDYFGDHLLTSGTYDEIFTKIFDDLEVTDNFADMDDVAGELFMSSIMEEVPELLSDSTADYLSDWMDYLKGAEDIDDIPILEINDLSDTLYDHAKDLVGDDEFMNALLADTLESRGDDIDNYSMDDYEYLIESLDVEDDFMASIDEAIADPEIAGYLDTFQADPLEFFGNDDMSDEEILENVQKSHGILRRYNNIAMLVYGSVILAIMLLFIMWINKIKVPLILNGIIFVLSALPLLFFSISEVLFNGIIRYIAQSILEFDLAINVYKLAAIRPIITSMTTVSAVVFGLGILLFIVGLIVGNNKSVQSNTIPNESQL